MTDTERTSLSGQIAALRAQLDAMERHANEREQRRAARDERLDARLEGIAEDRRQVEGRIASLEAVRPQAERVAREAHEVADAIHTQTGRREGRAEMAKTWWARLGVIAAAAGSMGGLVGATVAVMQVAGG